MSYRLPPSEIARIVDAAPPPALSVSPDRRAIAILGRSSLPGIADLSAPELRLAGVRINPRTNGPSREAGFTSIAFRPLRGGPERLLSLPEGVRITYPRWSPDSSRLAFLLTREEGIELWVADEGSATPRAVTGPELNATLGAPFAWMPDSASLLVLRVARDRGEPPERPRVPGGPIIHENLGESTPARTYQDLLASPHDEALFDHYFSGQVVRVALDGAPDATIGEPGIISDFGPCPSGRYVFLERITRPYSYRVPYHRFPAIVSIVDGKGETVRTIAELPLADRVPTAFDAVRAGPRAFQWRTDAPATLLWAEALDGGDPRVPAEKRDRVLLLSAPFDGAPTPLIELEHRYAGIQWGRDDFALVYSRWWVTRNEKRFVVAPSRPAAAPRILSDRSYDDRYGDPGMPVMTRNAGGGAVLLFGPDGTALYLAGEGASPRGDYPFLDRLDLTTGESERLWRAEDPYYEEVVAILDPGATRVITRRESHTEPPNYLLHELDSGSVTHLTEFHDPAPEMAGIQRRIITYPRADGVMLSGTLYLPPGYDSERDGRLPLLIWAYPREFRDAGDAAQLQDSPNRFTRPTGASHLFLLTQGYAILDGPAMPIIGEGSEEPNDSYVEQLVSDASAAVDRVVGMGVADRDRVGIGGHSYGAFMTANLLAHSDLFRAGIARSGAYNRTLTPFGFQQEQRSYWEAPETYNRMSPFAHAHLIRDPILIIHGEADDNSGTFPVQSERFYAALKGHGATVRYVVLPHEAHGYRARESVLHTLAEMTEWMDRYVKNAPPRDPSPAA
jgi:dipeptidyl aminopeptidase/acylaminoacyl peptidase